MKQENGVTLSSLIIYVISMLIVVGVIATLTSFFYRNIANLDDNSENIAEVTKFNIPFLEEVKQANNAVTRVSEDQTAISFFSGNTYTFQDQAIYKNKVRICENVKKATFRVEEIEGKQIVYVLLTIGENMEYTKTMEYVVKGIM